MTVVVLNYWVLVFAPDDWPDKYWMINGVQVHGLLFVALLFDFLLSAERLYYKSCIWSMLLGFLYLIWSIIFEIFINFSEVGDPYLYAVFNWSEHQLIPTIIFIISMIASCLITSFWAFIKNLILMQSR